MIDWAETSVTKKKVETLLDAEKIKFKVYVMSPECMTES